MCSIATLSTRVGPLHIYSESALMAVLTSISLDMELKGNYTHCNHEVHYGHVNHDVDIVKGKTQNSDDSPGEAKERIGRIPLRLMALTYPSGPTMLRRKHALRHPPAVKLVDSRPSLIQTDSRRCDEVAVCGSLRHQRS